MSSASSTARWIDCTVDSMFTTTPFFIPREGWCPTPTISTSPVGDTSPTMASTLEVPMSRPTISFSSSFLAMIYPLSGCVAGTMAVPFHREPVAVTQVHLFDIGGIRSERLRINAREPLNLVLCLFPVQHHHHSLVEHKLPGAPCRQRQALQLQSGRRQNLAQSLVACEHLRPGASPPFEPWEIRGDSFSTDTHYIARRVQPGRFTPVRRELLLDKLNGNVLRPLAPHRRLVNPGQGFHARLDRIQIEQKKVSMHDRHHRGFQLLLPYMFELAFEAHVAHGKIVRAQQTVRAESQHQQGRQQD